MKHIVFLTLFAFSMAGCGGSLGQTVKDIGNTINDAANIACQVFANEHPAEFAQLVRSVAPPGAVADAEKQAFDPKFLCTVKQVIDPFVQDLLSTQQARAAELRRQDE